MARLSFLLAALLVGGPAAAQMTAAEPSAPGPFAESVVSDDMLAATAGRTDLNQVTAAELRGAVSGNSINGPSMTGRIVIDGQAFQNLNGLAVLNANTGNNVAINSSMQVNVAISR